MEKSAKEIILNESNCIYIQLPLFILGIHIERFKATPSLTYFIIQLLKHILLVSLGGPAVILALARGFV